jgi:tRNA-2-methylthio-N6-dimethylallyladenosine synthase
MKKGKYHLIVTGCQMNRSDSERVSTVLESLGYEKTAKIAEACVVVFIACSVRQAAIDRVWGFAKKIKEEKLHREVVSVLTGCLLPLDRRQLKQRFDFVFEIKALDEFEKFLSDKQILSKDYLEVIPQYSNPYQAFVPIMTGCNNYCSYCAVPYARGREVSRSVKAVLQEIRNLAKSGCLEITLLGQNVNSYQPKDQDNFSRKNPFKHNFARLLWEVNAIKGIKRVSFASAHAKDMNDDVIAALKLPGVVNYLHLALQSGDNEILKKMNRKYTAQEYFKIIQKVRLAKPDIALGTDIIVGFPGETKKQFDNTVSFYKKVGFDIAYLAQYSPRKGTVAAKLTDNVSKDEKKRRWQVLQDLMEKATLCLNKKFVHQEVSVLVDNYYKGYCEGNSLEMKRVRFKGNKALLGKIVPIDITKAQEWLLSGKRKPFDTAKGNGTLRNKAF